jgi:hypothetical protein
MKGRGFRRRSRRDVRSIRESHGHLSATEEWSSTTPLVVDRSTTGANPVDWVETGWTHLQARGLERTHPVDGFRHLAKVRVVGFESGLPLQRRASSKAIFGSSDVSGVPVLIMPTMRSPTQRVRRPSGSRVLIAPASHLSQWTRAGQT